MSELLALQAGFATALRDAGQDEATTRWLAGDRDLVERRLAIYRANMVAAADKALSAAYPVIRQVLGDAFLHRLAREFQRAHPSTGGDLTVYGAGLDAFVAGFDHTQSLPWLPDLARLEWAVHRAHGAADAAEWDPAELGRVEPERQAAIRLRWTPGMAVVESRFPIVRVWTIHQAGYGGEFSVDWSLGETALVARDGFRVDVSACGACDAAFVAASLAGATLGDAAAGALARQPDFDLGALLARAFAARLLTGFDL